jgi:DNA-binding transcriptional MerR regulator
LSKATEAFRNIGEVSAELGVRKHVLRFWEAKFPQLKPMKRGGGRRYYRPADVQLLRGIRHLLQTAGYTIKGVQKILREDGAEDVKRIGSAQQSHRDDRTRMRPPPSHPPAVDEPRQFSAAEMSALRAITAELEILRTMLGGGSAQPAEHAGRRPKRTAAARG